MFEQETYGREMNHTLAVKQYSRSSADQEVPLHYELRPISILQLTMSYLMHNIMNLCENEEVTSKTTQLNCNDIYVFVAFD